MIKIHISRADRAPSDSLRRDLCGPGVPKRTALKFVVLSDWVTYFWQKAVFWIDLTVSGN